jgi:hypothetical protein
MNSSNNFFTSQPSLALFRGTANGDGHAFDFVYDQGTLATKPLWTATLIQIETVAGSDRAVLGIKCHTWLDTMTPKPFRIAPGGLFYAGSILTNEGF